MAEILCYSDPITMGKINFAEALLFSTALIYNAVTVGLSIVGREKESGKILSYCIANDAISDRIPDTNLTKVLEQIPSFKRVMALLGCLHRRFKIKGEIVSGEIYELILDGTRQGYEGKGIGVHSRMIARELAMKKEFKGMVVQTTDENTRQVWEKLGFTQLGAIHLPTFCFDEDGTEEYPWLEVNQTLVLLGQMFEEHS